MYTAKSDGGNRLCVFDPTIEAERVDRQRLESDLRSAVEADDLEVVYQPIVDASTKCVVGVEALSRWDRPGGIFLEVFIAAAKSSGLIGALGLQVLRKACPAGHELAAPATVGECIARSVSRSGVSCGRKRTPG